MQPSSYEDRDYNFGQAMLSLRTESDLTQAKLADLLGVSRKAVVGWESGTSYPTPRHLKHFIELCLQNRAFHAAHEAEEIRALWLSAHQKVRLDEAWLSRVLAAPPSEAKIQQSTPPAAPSPGTSPQVDWGDALEVTNFYGREAELAELTAWLLEEHCKVVSVLGLGGIGKSSLAVRLMEQVAAKFDVVIWRSLRDATPCEALLDDLLRALAQKPLGIPLDSLERRLNLLFELLRSRRVLLVLDNLESVMVEAEGSGHMLPGYEGYGRLLGRAAETRHQSCLLVTSREKPSDLAPMEGSRTPVRSLHLDRLDAQASKYLLVGNDVVGTAGELERLSEFYAGNPLALKIVARTIVELFDGEIAPFLAQGELIFGGVRDLLDEQFARLSAVEENVIVWLAILREPVSLPELVYGFVNPLPRVQVLEALDTLRGRSLIERGSVHASFTLQSVVLEYVTARLIETVVGEIEQSHFERLIDHRLVPPRSKQYVREAQERLIVAPILARLRNASPAQETLEARLHALLVQWRGQPDFVQGYGPANVFSLLRVKRGDLRGLDLSGLALRGVNLDGVEMQDTSLAGASILDCIFTDAFDIMITFAVNSTATYWAASDRGGEVRVWDAGGSSLRRAWHAHSDMIWALTFSPDGCRLASGSWDGTVKVWDVESGALLWQGRHASTINGVAFSHGGSRLASTGLDATVQIWDLRSEIPLQTLPHPNPLSEVTWSPDDRLIASSDVKGFVHLWELSVGEPARCVQTMQAHTSWVDGLDFSPDGRTLATGSWDSTVKLWDISALPAGEHPGESPPAHLRETLVGHTDRVIRVVWSPDGRTVASSSRDHRLLLWDVEQHRYRATLLGHSAGVNGFAFTPDSRNLVSSSEDGTLRVWDSENGQCARVIHGRANALFDVDWSPDSTQLVSGGTDHLVTIFAANGAGAPRVMRGHSAIVCAVGWSPAGQWLASSERIDVIRLWDPSTGVNARILRQSENYDNSLGGVAWSPDGQHLASGSLRHGVLVFEVGSEQQSWADHQSDSWIQDVAWSPDGSRLAGCGDINIVYMWDAMRFTLLHRLTGHQNVINRVAWGPDSKRLASGGYGNTGGELFVWDVERGEPLRPPIVPPAVVYALAWDATGERVISGDDDGILHWWDVASGESVLDRKAHQGKVQALRVSPDRTRLASCGDDGAIMIWDLASGAHLRTLRRDRPYERLDITGIKGLADAQKLTLRMLGAIEDGNNGE